MTSVNTEASDGNEEAPTLPLRQLGRLLRRVRDEQGFSIARVAELVELSPASVQRYETGKIKKVRTRDIQAICEVLDVSDTDTERAIELAEQAKVKSWYTAFGGLYSDSTFNLVVGLTESARHIVAYNELVLGLLQTPDYARTVISGYFRDESPEDIERRVELRLKRQAIVTRKTAPVKLDMLLHESALHRVVGSPRIMVEQCHHLAEVSKLPNVSIRIQQFSAGAAWGVLPGPFMLLDFGTDAKGKPVEPPLIYLEALGASTNDLYLEKPDDVRRYHMLASAIRDTSLDEQRSRDLLRQVARSYTA
jgi:transcriptional regulator with XRE-family HTH domain